MPKEFLASGLFLGAKLGHPPQLEVPAHPQEDVQGQRTPHIKGPASCVPLKMSSKCWGKIKFPSLHTQVIKRSGGKAQARFPKHALNVAVRSLLSFFIVLAAFGLCSAAIAARGVGPGTAHGPGGERRG